MMNKKKKKTKLLVFMIISCILLFCLYFFNKYNYLSKLHIFFYDIGINIKNIFTLKYSDLNNDIYIGIDNELLKENRELKSLLDLNIADYEMITCSVIKKELSNTLTLNRGRKDNIDINMAVINSNGLIGRISEVGNNYSIVELITSDKNTKIAVNVGNYQGILYSYIEPNIIIKNISKNSDIKIGDKVYTNGLGGIYPSGIYIGEVSDVGLDDNLLSKTVKVKVFIDYNINYVNVIRR